MLYLHVMKKGNQAIHFTFNISATLQKYNKSFIFGFFSCLGTILLFFLTMSNFISFDGKSKHQRMKMNLLGK